jgi:hypothetical protein
MRKLAISGFAVAIALAACTSDESRPRRQGSGGSGSGGSGGATGGGGRALDAEIRADLAADVPYFGTGGKGGLGGVLGTGGTFGSGGAPGTGGAVGGGGGTGTGGSLGAGGVVGTGGAIGRGGTDGTGGARGTGGATAACSEGTTQCLADATGVRTCTSGQWGPAVACGPRQICTLPAGTAKCTCKADPVCASVGGTCSSPSVLASCAQDAQACFYQSSATTCTNGACSGPAGAASCCTNACAAGGGQCLSSTSLQTCAVGANGCTVATTQTCTCAGPAGSAACVGSTWAEWPMPNSQVDVSAGAPNLASYTDNGNGTVTDNVTGLMWQQVVAPGTYTWAQAKAYCPTLTLAGKSDWRLPTRIELVSLVDFGQSNPAINTTYFPSTSSDWFWSSSPLAGSSSSAWIVYFYRGLTVDGDVSNAILVRCVR